MKTIICESALDLGQHAAHEGAAILRKVLTERDHARIILATGASQFTMLDALLNEPDIAWHRITMFHLDEYLGLPPTHPASFRKYLWERFVSKLPVPLQAAHWIDGEANIELECHRLGKLISHFPIDLAFIGIGENGHLAFNDPPADFETEKPFIPVQLDEACRQQQLGEGWFATFNDVPDQAISMSIQQIMKSKAIICSVPDSRKARAVENAVKGPVTPAVPASILQNHRNCRLFLDTHSAALL
ncbi:MAG: glucosamine-6-phosphate deaminase [Planctomycetia bacterium]|nr:glucosamine-6-phosphate deaminase [Planctomycetia bacterium]